MDDITRQFLILAHKIQHDIHQALEELRLIHKTSDPAHEEYSADHEADAPEKEGELLAAIKTLQNSNNAADSKKYALDHRRYRLEWKGYFVGRLTAVLLFVYTSLTLIVAVYSIRSANAVKQSADTQSNSFEMEKRRAEDQEEAVCRFQGNGMAAFDHLYHVQVINTGKAKARNIETHGLVYIASVPGANKIRDLADIDIRANEIPSERSADQIVTLPLSAQDWQKIADTKEILAESGAIQYENGFGRTLTERFCNFWLYFRTPEDRNNPVSGRGATCDRLQEQLAATKKK